MSQLLVDPGKLTIHPKLKYVRLEILVNDEDGNEPDVPKVKLRINH
jgi:hypothetical protein